MQKLSCLLFKILFIFLSFSSWAEVNYYLTITDPSHHLAQVTIEIPIENTQEVIVNLPSWRTGRYEILDLAKAVTHFQAYDKNKQPLTWQKVNKSSWKINTSTVIDKIIIDYQIIANDLGTRSRHIDDSHAFIDASGFFMYSDISRAMPQKVTLFVPDDWRSVSGLTRVAKHQFIAKNYDILIDSPIETGINKFREFSVAKRAFEIVVWGEGNYNLDTITEDLKQLVQVTEHIWENTPFERYVFMIHATSVAKGATEHKNSTIIQRNRYEFAKRKDYIKFLRTAAHELIHTWNVKHYRPEGLVPYDYQQENFSPLLWLAEGSTSYFQDQLLLQAELITLEEFLTELAKRIDQHQQRPGKNEQSVAMASTNTWFKYHSNFALNYTANIYAQGYFASWLIDHHLLTATNLEHSYRTMHNEMNERFALPKSYNEQQLIQLMTEFVGTNQSQWWQQYIQQPLVIDFSVLLQTFGLKFVDEEEKEPELGIKLNNKKQIKQVRRGSAAWKAGLALEDEIIAINGLKLHSKSVAALVNHLEEEQKVVVDYFRRDQLQQTTIQLEFMPSEPPSIEVVAEPSSAQQQLFEHWLGIDWPKQLDD